MRRIKYIIKDVYHKAAGFIPASILCIRFPFLYPRNVYTGRHYNSWKLNNAMHSCEVKGKNYDDVLNKKADKIEWTSRWHHMKYNILKFIYNILEVLHAVPWYTRLDAMPSGWRKSFGIQMCKEIRDELLRAGGRKLLNAYRITDIKEKYGTLHWYDAWAPRGIRKIIMKYEYISERTCICCGKPADGMTPIEYWRSPYCRECRPERSKYFLEFGLEGNESWYGYTGAVNEGTAEEIEEAKENSEEYHNLED